MTDAEWAMLEEEVRARAFTVSGVSSMQTILEIYNALDKAIADGIPWSEFQALVADAVDFGRLGTVYDTNIQTAYGSGRLEQHQSVLDVYPYGEYDGVGDSRERAWHRALHGQIHRMDSEFWRLHYPPWEFN